MNTSRSCYALFAVMLLSTTLLAADKPPQLPVRRVVLFTSGVAFVEHGGEVEGTQTIDLQFHVDDVNDLLKSMVLHDEGGGRVESVSYTPQEPLAVQLGQLRIDPSRIQSLGDLLLALRGERIQVELTPNSITGFIVAVDRRKSLVPPDQVVEQETLLIKTETGLRNVSLASVVSVKLLDEALDRDLQQALTLVAGAKSVDKKQVSLLCQGEGKRQIRVGYIQEFPVWKASYRLVMSDKKEPQLQGWAIVENTTDQDWKDVHVALVNGRPVSFTMDLYSPVFLARPSVVPQLFAGLAPQMHAQDLVQAQEALAARAGGLGGGGGGFGGGGFAAPSQRPFVTSVIPLVGGGGGAPFDPRSSLQVAAATSEVGTFFRYELEHPVTLAHQKSMMLPIVDAPVKLEKTAVYNRETQEKHPLSAIQLTNSTKLQLMSGPVTLFEAGEYAGDAELPNLAPLDKRLVTYALDLNVEVLAEAAPESPEAVTRIVFDKGVATVTRRQVRSKSYTLKNSSASDRKVLIEQPRDIAWKLIAPAQPAETSRDVYRFAVTVPAGKPVTLTVAEEHVRSDAIAARRTSPDEQNPFPPDADNISIDDAFAATHALARTLPDPSKPMQVALQKWGELAAAVRETSVEHNRVSDRRTSLATDQQRIRANLAAVPPNTDLQRRYLKTLDDQETEIVALQKRQAELESTLHQRQTALLAFLTQLQVE